ncbi:MAG: tetratricopeptide repeat protein, partial [Deltaproteobacteria bacterium]|nr:tetratricopeptide repeat protein [Deltaproteobacteria bacterium]
MGVLLIVGRILTIAGGFVLFAFGAAALGVAYLPENEIARVASRLAVGIGGIALSPFAEDPREVMAGIQAGFAMRFLAAPVGLIAFVAALLPGSPKIADGTTSDGGTLSPETDAGVLRKKRRHASSLAKREGALAAAEYCFDNGLMQDAADYFIEAEQWVRAAEIRHDEERFIESAELYMKGERFDAAGRIFAQQEENARAGDAYSRAGNQGIAAELFEKAGEHLKAAKAYDESGYPRQAAQAYVKCGNWDKAAVCLEQTILEETTGGRGDGFKNPEVQKLVRMAGNLFERAGQLERAETVLERGECFAEAAEIALRGNRDEKAVELFLRAKDAPRAADVMTRLGQEEEAARVLAEYHRDLGDDEEAARCFEKAGELLNAGDTYRMLEQYEKAGECYERFGDAAQAA